MDGLRYRAGDWIALAHASRVVLLSPGSSQERIDTVWDILSRTGSLDAVFDVVTGGLSGKLSQLPPFALLSVDADARVLLRGPLELTVSGSESPAATGEHLRTWSEQVLPASGLAVLREAGSPPSDAGTAPPLLTLRDGMAAVSCLEIDFDAARGSAAGRPAPENVEAVASPVRPVAAPVPPPAAVPPAPATPAAPAAPVAAVPPAAVPPAAGPPAAVPPAAGPPAAVPPAAGPPAAAPDLSGAVPWLELTPPPLSPEAGPLFPEPAAGEPAADPGEPTETLPPVLEDHDGETIMGFTPQPGTAVPGTPHPDAPPSGGAGADDEQTVRSSPAAGRQSEPAASAENGPTVLARKCPQGHVNPPTAGNCLTCGAEVSGDPAPEPRPSLGLMRLSTGAVYELDRNAVVGRQPSASREQGSLLPRMVQVPSESGDISRSHAEIRLEGWHVMLRDLFSTNGTVLHREGQLPRRLAQGEAAMLLDGDVAELGDNVSIRFEGLA